MESTKAVPTEAGDLGSDFFLQCSGWRGLDCVSTMVGHGWGEKFQRVGKILGIEDLSRVVQRYAGLALLALGGCCLCWRVGCGYCIGVFRFTWDLNGDALDGDTCVCRRGCLVSGDGFWGHRSVVERDWLSPVQTQKGMIFTTTNY